MGGYAVQEEHWCYQHNGNQSLCEASMIYNVTEGWTTSAQLVYPANAVNPVGSGKPAANVWKTGVMHDIGDRFRRCLYGLVEPGKCSMSEVDEFCNLQPPPPPAAPPSPFTPPSPPRLAWPEPPDEAGG